MRPALNITKTLYYMQQDAILSSKDEAWRWHQGVNKEIQNTLAREQMWSSAARGGQNATKA